MATVAGATTTAPAGCGVLASGPDPAVVEHVRGDVAVTETGRVFDLGNGDGRVKATVENSGDAGTVAAKLVDTSDAVNTQTLASRDVELAADERRPVLFEVYEDFDVFRVGFD